MSKEKIREVKVTFEGLLGLSLTHRRGDFHLHGELFIGDGVELEMNKLSSAVELDLNLRF